MRRCPTPSTIPSRDVRQGRWKLNRPANCRPDLWIIAACGAIALHVGCIALAVAHMRADEADDELGANAIEIGMTLVVASH